MNSTPLASTVALPAPRGLTPAVLALVLGAAALLQFGDGRAFRRKQISVKGRTTVVEPYRYMDFRLVNSKGE